MKKLIKLIPSCLLLLFLLVTLIQANVQVSSAEKTLLEQEQQSAQQKKDPLIRPIDSIINKPEKDPLKVLTQNLAISCDVCKLVVHEIEQYLKEHEPEIEKQLVHLCGYLPLQYEQICDTIVLMYGHTILELLLKYENASTVCGQQLHLCPPSLQEPSSKFAKLSLEKSADDSSTAIRPSLKLIQQRFGDEMECTLCEMMVAWVEHFLNANKTHHDIVHWLKAVCLRLPSSVTGTCVSMVKEYVPYMIEKLEKKFPPHRVCKEVVPMCSFKRFEPFGAAAIEDQYSSTCALCRNVTTIVYQRLDQEDWQNVEKVEHALLHHVCKHIAPQYRHRCKQYVLAADPVLFMDRYFTRADQCAKDCEVDLKTDEIEMQKQQIVTLPVICACCRYLVNFVNHYITKKSTEKEIVHVIEQVCPFFPRTYRSECVALVEKYGSTIVKILATYVFTPSTVCFLSQCCG